MRTVYNVHSLKEKKRKGQSDEEQNKLKVFCFVSLHLVHWTGPEIEWNEFEVGLLSQTWQYLCVCLCTLLCDGVGRNVCKKKCRAVCDEKNHLTTKKVKKNISQCKRVKGSLASRHLIFLMQNKCSQTCFKTHILNVI